VEALGALDDGASRPVLLKTCLDPHPRVRAASLAVLGDRKDRGLAGLFQTRFAEDPSDVVKAEALRALGKTGDPSRIPFLERVAASPSFRNLLGAAAGQALKSLGR